MAVQKKHRHNGFLMQATVLAVAGIVVRIIGLLYRSPMNEIIGDEGVGYYGYAYNIYTMILMISTYSVPMAISKIISERLVLKEYRNAHRIFKASLGYVTVVGGIAAVVAFVFAPQLASENSALALRILAPTIFLSGILGVFRGYFQAHRTMAPTSISQIIEQVINALFSILAAWTFIKLFASSNATASTAPIVGAAGGTLGTGMGVIAGLAFMMLGYWAMKPKMRRRIRSDRTSVVESYSTILKVILLMVTPIVFSTCINNLSITIDMKVFQHVMETAGMKAEATASLYGVFSNKYAPLINVPIALASAMATAMMPEISASFAQRNMKQTKQKIAQAVRFTMMISIPATVGIAVLARPIMQILFPQPDTLELASNLLTLGAISIVLTGLSTLSIAILQGTGHVNIPVKHAAIALICDVGILFLLLKFTQLGVYTLVIGTIINSTVMFILNNREIHKRLGYRQTIANTFGLPIFSSVLMGIFAWGVYAGVHWLVKSNLIALVVAVAVAGAVYFALMLRLGGIGAKELNRLPKGGALVKLAKKFHFI